MVNCNSGVTVGSSFCAPCDSFAINLCNITDQSSHHFELWAMGRSDRFNIGLTPNAGLSIHFVAKQSQEARKSQV